MVGRDCSGICVREGEDILVGDRVNGLFPYGAA